MAETMASSSITDGQIDKAADTFRAILRKHRTEFESDATQQVLGSPHLGPRLLAVFRQMVEAVSGTIVRRVKVNRGLDPQSMLDALGRRQYANRDVVATMPHGQADEGDVVFFHVGSVVSDDELEAEFESRNLMPADPYKVAAVNRDDPAFADEHPNATHWKDSQGRWCYFACSRGGDERFVDVDRNDHDDWYGNWWFAGVRKFSGA